MNRISIHSFFLESLLNVITLIIRVYGRPSNHAHAVSTKPTTLYYRLPCKIARSLANSEYKNQDFYVKSIAMKTITKKIICNMIACNTTNTGPRSTKLKKRKNIFITQTGWLTRHSEMDEILWNQPRFSDNSSRLLKALSLC